MRNIGAWGTREQEPRNAAPFSAAVSAALGYEANHTPSTVA
jgi:hypothetical protein